MNAHSSRSHAILGVKVAISSEEETRVSTVSAIDLAGSEDNRRTDNDKERMVESASINKSLFVLAQCVEAISKKAHRIPYRESKMTRILSLGQNHGLTVMILNLAPLKSYHLDTLSSLNFANRTKKIEVREVENEPMFKGPPRPSMRPSLAALRQPLRPLTASVNANLGATAGKDSEKPGEKPVKAFSVFSDRQKRISAQFKKPEVPKRPSLSADAPAPRLPRATRLGQPALPQRSYDEISSAKIEEMVERKVEEILAVRAVSEQSRQTQVRELNEQMRKRLEQLEQRIEGSEDARAEGLSYLLMAKQHQGRGEDASALRMYQLALPFFPDNEKLAAKISKLQARTHGRCVSETDTATSLAPPSTKKALGSMLSLNKQPTRSSSLKRSASDSDADYEEAETFSHLSDDDVQEVTRSRRLKRNKTSPSVADEESALADDEPAPSPRTIHLLSVINSRDVSQIKLLKGVGAKKAEAIVDCLCEMDHNEDESQSQAQMEIHNLVELSKLRGVGVKSVETMRSGLLA